jgi:hypothetical protein
MSSNTYIYALEDPITNIIKYIGKSDDPAKRLDVHLNRLSKNTAKNSWLKSLSEKPNILILDEIQKTEWGFWEKYWISQFKTWGFKLKNSTNGGDGGDTNSGKKFGKYSLEVRKNISIGTKKAMMSKSIKEKCRKGAYITFKKTCDSNGKLRPDIVNKIREGSKKPVCIINNNNETVKIFTSIEDFLKEKKMSYSKFLRNRIVKEPNTEVRRNKDIIYYWKDK